MTASLGRQARVMARNQNPHLLHELARLPWWVSVVVAAVVYLLAHWVAPAVAGGNMLLRPFATVLSTNAHWIAAIFLLPIPFALINASTRRKLVDGQASIDRIRELTWQEFEQLVGEAYRRQGYRVAERGGGGADGGIDLELRTKDKTLVVQCKRWRTRTIGVELVRELYGAMTGEQAHAAIFVTSGDYTPDAIDFARDKPIKLVDGRGLVAMLQDIQGPRQAAHARPPQTDMVLPTATNLTGTTTHCPACGGRMVKRVAKRGAERGREFWGCSRFPACRGTRPIL